METLLLDLRYAIRTLGRNPGLAAVALLTIALGIGANTAMFSVVNAVVLRPLPYANAERLVWITQQIRELHAEIAAGPDYLAWRDENRTFERLAAYQENSSYNLTGGGSPERVTGASVSASFFATFGAQPSLGRTFTDGEDQPGGNKVAVITDGFRRRRFASDAEVLGQQLNLNGQRYTVIGVMPAGFRFPGNSRLELLLPLALDAQKERQRMQMTIVRVVGLLKPGKTLAECRADISAISARNMPQFALPGGTDAPPPMEMPAPSPAGASEDVMIPGPAPGPERPAPGEFEVAAPPPGAVPFPPRRPAAQRRSLPFPNAPEPRLMPAPRQMAPHIELRIAPLHDVLVGDFRTALLLLASAVGLVLLIACGNMANLMLARASARSREIAVRASLGAGRWRLLRQLLTESVLISVAGGAFGLMLAVWGVHAIVGLTPRDIAGEVFRLVDVRIDTRVVAFTFVVSVLTGILFGLAPALGASKPDLMESLKESATGAFGALRRTRLKNALVTAEFALALVLLIGAGLLVKSFYRLMQVDPGYRPEKVLTMAVHLTESKYATDAQRREFFADLVKRVQALPSVTAAAAGNSLPLTQYSAMLIGIQAEGRPLQQSGTDPVVSQISATPDFFRALGIRLLSGRPFSDADGADAARICIVNETFASHFWPSQDPLGRKIGMGPGGPGNRMSVVGVVADIRHNGLAAETQPEIYVPFQQSPHGEMALAVQTAGSPLAVINAVRRTVWSLDPEQPVFDVTTMEERLSDSVAPRRFNMLLLGIFAGMAVLLASVGIYGLMSYSVAQRTREIGIRMALGARRQDAIHLVARQALALIAIGAVIGLAASLALGRLLTSMLYSVDPNDPLTFTFVTLLLASVAALASYIPARRAANVDPVVALRYE